MNIILLLSILMLFTQTNCSISKHVQNNAGADSTKKILTPQQKIEATIVTMINNYRQAQGLDTLQTIKEITEVAEEHSANMAKGKVAFGHDGFANRFSMLKNRLVQVTSAAENVAYGRNLPIEKIIEGWIQSKGHKKNIEGSYTATGVGIYVAKNGTVFYTQIFVTQASK